MRRLREQREQREPLQNKKKLKHLYRPSAKKVVLVDVPEMNFQMNFLMIDGQGDPNSSQAFQDAIAALYPFTYALKFMVKKGEIGVDLRGAAP